MPFSSRRLCRLPQGGKTVSSHDLTDLLPVILIATTAVLLMLIVAIKRSHRLTFGVSLLGMAIAFVSLWPASAGGIRAVSELLVIDQFALFYMGLLLASTAAILLYSYSYFETRQEHKEEFYMLVLLATTGGIVLVASSHFVSFFLGLEILSVALYGLVAY